MCNNCSQQDIPVPYIKYNDVAIGWVMRCVVLPLVQPICMLCRLRYKRLNACIFHVYLSAMLFRVGLALASGDLSEVRRLPRIDGSIDRRREERLQYITVLRYTVRGWDGEAGRPAMPCLERVCVELSFALGFGMSPNVLLVVYAYNTQPAWSCPT